MNMKKKTKPAVEIDNGASSGGIIYRIKGEWLGKSAGGCLNFASWRWNQQIFFTSSETKNVKIRLVQEDMKKNI